MSSNPFADDDFDGYASSSSAGDGGAEHGSTSVASLAASMLFDQPTDPALPVADVIVYEVTRLFS